MSQDYRLVQEVLADGDIPIKCYINRITGLRVFISYVEYPIVKGDLIFATEAHDDDGLPHTLEHLVFLGSEDYPYKGVLDQLANLCFADGTNAYTDTDHTNYTASTAGAEGFLKLLPVYLDHLLFPTLTDAAFVTEVHHIDGNGEDAGVVYCEMQGRENNGESRCYLEMLRGLYPGRCGYKSETGGLLENLRNSTTNEKCRNYHREFYHSQNLAVLIVGPVQPEEVFESIKPIEDKIVAKNIHKKQFTRPWSTSVEPLNKSFSRKIQYSSDTDDDGLVYIGFRGPNVITDFSSFTALSMLLEYLDSTSISPLQRDFVECPEPYCSSVSHNVIENSSSCVYLTFDSVGKKYLDLVADRLFATLNNIANGTEKFDMERMRVILSRRIVRLLSTAENSPHSIVAGSVIGHFLYGEDDLTQRCQEIPILKEFLNNSDAQFWCGIMEKYLTGPTSRYVCIVGEPSPELMREMSKAEENRIKKQKEDLKDDLASLAAKLKLSIEANETPIPTGLLKSIAPSTENIKFHPIERVVPDKCLTPFRFQYDSIRTNFVSIYLLMNTSNALTRHDRLYLPLLTELLLESPIMRDGQQLPYENVVAELFSDTINYGASIGLSLGNSIGPISMLLGLTMQVEVEKYEKAVKWCRELLFQTVFTVERIKTTATRLVSDIAQYKRKGGKVTSATLNALVFQSNSNQWASNFVRQHKFLKNLLKNLEPVPKELDRIREIITRPDNILVHLSLNKEKIDVSRVHLPWLDLIPRVTNGENFTSHISFENITPCHDLVDLAKDTKAALVGVGSVESNYLYQVVKTINSHKHPDLPALYVLIQYLTQLEGPLWNQIRGLGLSYSYSIDISPAEGLLKLVLAKSTQLVSAYKKCREILDGLLLGTEEFDDQLLESAKSILIFELIKSEKSPATKSTLSLLSYIQGLDIDFNRHLIKEVAKVTKEDMRRVGPLYLKPLFEDEEKRTAVCCHPSKIKEITKGLAAVGCLVKTISLEEEPLLNQFQL